MSNQPHFQLYINGEFRAGDKQQTMPSINPANGQEWATFDCASASDVETAVQAAKAALNAPQWADLNAGQRAKLINKLADLIEKNAAELGQIETQDSGKLLVETAAQTAYVADYYRYFASLATTLEGSVIPIDKPDMHVYTSREPIGVVCAIPPWNAQMFLTATKLGPALAAGCTVIIKASEVAPCPMLKFAELIHQAGFPPGVVSVITGDIQQCAVPLTSHPDIDRIAFTGGPETARNVIRNSAENFAVTSLELGGKSPIIVFDDADLESAANGLIAGNFGASGQSCVAGSRALIQRGVYDQLVAKLIDKSKDIIVGDPLAKNSHMGPLATPAQIDLAEQTLTKAKAQGAVILIGGAAIELNGGNYFQATIVECPTPDIATLSTEFFGPIMSLLVFDTEREAIALANDSKFGLGSGIFTQNLARAHRVSKKIHSGICWVNTYRAISPYAPFGGYNQSGYGREAGSDALLDYTRTKTTWINLSDDPMGNPFVMR
ncbi:MAG: acyl-CoA reductase-like NAD-dependent aldehyde dehydrogenase [Arenicella sp.]|jgi:acyl-CoA reductase-like NAD-dependent aldehyde dehydrogenase